jgi:peroxiredoxin
MNKFCVCLIRTQFLIFFFFSSAAFVSSTSNYQFKFKNVDGAMLSLDDVKGKNGTVVYFVSNTCEVTKKLDGFVRAFATDYAKKGIGFVAINSNDPVFSTSENFEAMKKKSFPFPYLADEGGRLARFFGAKKNAEYFLLDNSKNIVFHAGADPEPLKEALQAKVTGSKIQQPVQIRGGTFIALRPLK